MGTTTAERTVFGRLTRSAPSWVPLSVVALVIGTAPVFLRTFINDDATYTIVAQKLNAGALLYRDAVDNKPPLIYVTFAAIFRLCGTACPAAVKVATLFVQLTSAALVALIGRRLFGARVGAAAALLFSLAAVSGPAEDFAAPNTEIYANLFALAAVAVLCRAPDHPAGRRLWAGGALVGLACLYRLQAGAALLGLLLHLVSRDADGTSARDRFGAAARVALGAGLVLSAAITFFWAAGTLGDLWLWAVRNNLAYVRVGESRAGWRALGRIALVIACQFPLLLAGTRVALVWRRVREPHRARLRLLFFQLLAALFAYRTGNRFHGHYFVQALPWLALIGGWGMIHLAPAARGRLRLVPAAMAVVLLVFTAINAGRLSAPREDDGLDSAAAAIRAATGPDDELLLWSAPAEVAMESGRRFATRFPFNNYLTGRIFGTDYALPGTSRLAVRALESPEAWALLMGDLTASPPAVIVDGASPGFEIAAYPRLASLLRVAYAPARRVGAFAIYRRL